MKNKENRALRGSGGKEQKMKKFGLLVSVFSCLLFILTACGGGGSSPAVTQTPGGGNTNTPSVTNTPVPPSPPITNTPTPPVPWMVNGVTGALTVDASGNVFVVTNTDTQRTATSTNDVFLTKFDKAGNLDWKQPLLVTAGYDECKRVVVMGGYVYALCVEDDPSQPFPGGSNTGVVWLEKLDAQTGAQVSATKIADYGAPTGVVTDAVTNTNTLYVCWSDANGISTIVRMDPDGNVLNTTSDSPGDSTGVGMFLGIMVPDGNYLYSVGVRMQSAAYDRIVAVRFDKDLTNPVVSQYREFSDSQYPDMATGAVLSDGTLYIGGVLDDSVVDSRRGVLLAVDASTGNITDVTPSELLTGKSGFAQLAVANGALFGVLNMTGPVAKVDLSTMSTSVLTSITSSLGINLAVDAADGVLYATDNQSSSVFAYDLNGNPIP